MTISDINSFVNLRTGTTTTEYSAANRLISTNRHYHKVTSMILDSLDGWDFDDSNRTTYPVATTDLVANQQDYTFPSGLLKIKRVEVRLAGTWRQVTSLDINQHSNATDTTSISNDFSVDEPYYDLEANALKLYPIPTSNVTGGLKIWYAREVSEFTSGEVTTGTKEPGFDEPFHPMIPLGMCYDWFVSKMGDKTAQAKLAETKGELAEYEARLRKYYGSKQTDSVYQLIPSSTDYK